MAVAEEPAVPAHRYIGVVGCAATNCHGGSLAGALVTKGRNGTFNSAQVYLQSDPHASAWQTLQESRSQKIAALLHASDGLGADATRRLDCLACHATTSSAAHGVPNGRFTPSEGVGCEACHGPAELWVHDHAYQHTAWAAANRRFSTPQDLEDATGFRSTRDLVVRATTCARCHVGGTGRDMHHDMIAAGHPRLLFEFASYHDRLPKHWDETADRNRHTTTVDGQNRSVFEAKSWLIGQLVTADAGLRLLRSRATSDNRRWPELSEYDCYSCHHNLQSRAWASRTAEDVGRLRWNSWASAGFNTGLHTVDDSPLRAAMNARPDDIENVNTQTNRALESLSAALESTEGLTEQQVISLYERATAKGAAGEFANWDSAAQNYLAAVALKLAIHELRGERSSESTELSQIRARLLFAENTDGPAESSPEALREAVRSAYRSLAEKGTR